MGSGACWTPFARLLEADHHVVMPDARGHGRSGAPGQGCLYPDHADDVVRLVGALGLTDPVVLGHSMGGMTAALAASRLGSALRGLILVEPTFISPERQREVFESDVAEQHRRFLTRERRVLLAEARARQPHRSSEIIELVTDARLQTRMEALQVLTPPNPDFRDLVRRVRAPTLLVTAADGIVPPGAAEELRRLNPGLRWALIPDAGHGLPYDQPERLAAAVKPFLRSLQPA